METSETLEVSLPLTFSGGIEMQNWLKWDAYIKNAYIFNFMENPFHGTGLSYIPVNNRKPELFSCFRAVQKKTSGNIWVNKIF